MKKNLLLLFLALCSLNAVAADYYWVNGGGLWSDLSHWRLGSSGGSIPSIVPSSSDNVFFTSASGFGTLAADRTVTLDANGFCNNMSWDAAVPNNPIFTRSSNTLKIEIWNNLSLAPSVTHQMSIVFKGTGSSSFTTNGSVGGIFAFEIDKAGGTLNLTDSFVCASTSSLNNMILTAGTFNAAGKPIRAYQFNSNNTTTRALDISGSTLVLTSRWDLRGANKTLSAGSSRLTANAILLIDGGTYNEVNTGGLFDGDMSVSNATIAKLSFTNVSSGSFATVTNGNIIDTLNFRGRGRIYNSNRIGKATFANAGNVLGTKNIFGTLLAQSKLNITGTDTTTVDSLLLAPNQATVLAGTILINQHLKAQGLTCQAFTEITATDSAKLYFAAASSALMDNVYLTNIMAFGSITPIAVSGVDGGNNTGFTITPPASLSGTTLYWVGGAGDWNDNAHWSYTSGGSGGACIPFIYDTVIFNSGSGLVAGNIVTTSGNSYCRNISWLPGVGSSTFSQGAGTTFNVYGSAVLTPAIRVDATLEFAGTDSSATIRFNGSTLGNLNLVVKKASSAALTLADDWSNTTGTASLTTGHLNMPGRNVNIQYISSISNVVRYMDLTNATIRVSNTFAYTGSNNFVTATGSHIISDLYLNIANRYYPSIELSYGGTTDVFNINQSTIDSLTFTNTAATGMAKVGNTNTIRRLEFKGAGYIIANNTIDTLILAGSRNYRFGGTTTLNKYLQAVSASCTGLLEMRGNTAGTFQFNPSAVINMANVYLQNMTATGVPPVPVSGADAGGNSGWNITSSAGSPHYWIGGSGDWNEAAHWSLSSGGTGGACIPTVYDDVYFDANSGFTAISKTVTINNGNAYARNIDWSAATNSPIWNKSGSWNMEIWGDSLILNSAATFNALVTAKGGARPVYMRGNVLGDFDFAIDKPGSSLTMLNDFSNAQTNISLLNGTWNASGIKVSVLQVDNSAGTNNVFAINISNSTVVAPFGWRFQGSIPAHSMNAANSSITTSDFKAAGMTYDTVNMTNTLTSSVNMVSATIKTLTFTNPSNASAAGIVGNNNTLGRVEYKGSGVITGTNNSIDTLIFFPGGNYTLTAGTNTTITGAWYGSGTPCRLTEIFSSSTSANATVTMNGGGVDLDYIRVRRITAAGTAIPFIARQHSIDLGSNTNWNIAPYDGASPIFGLGPDTALYASEFPYTLQTNGFFGSPSSQYTWNDASTADSLQITGAGTYSVRVNFVDGCTINDTIVVTLRTILPITLSGFNARLQDCRAYLGWQTPSASDLSRFVIERSTDGQRFSELGSVSYSKPVQQYSYVDQNIENGLSLYRLRMVYTDGSTEYSTAVSVRSDCSIQPVSVYPTQTNDLVFVQLPAAFEAANIAVLNGNGQLLSLPGSGAVDNKQVHRISFKGQAQGTYLMQISHKGQVQTVKLFYQP